MAFYGGIMRRHPLNGNLIRSIKMGIFSPEFNQYKNPDYVKALITRPDFNGYSPLEIAIIANNYTAIKFLIENGVNINEILPGSKMYPIFLGFRVGLQASNAYIINLLIDSGANINIEDKSGYTPLYYAIKQENYIEIIDKLIRNGADINKTYESKNSILHEAALANNLDSARYLLDAGIDSNTLNSNKQTPLHLVCKLENPKMEIIELLVNAGANINIFDNLKQTPLSYFIVNSKPYPSLFNPGSLQDLRIAEYLISHGANINITVQAMHNQSLLSIAIQKRNDVLVKLLIDNGAIITDMDITTANRNRWYASSRPIDLDPVNRDWQYRSQKIYDMLNSVGSIPIDWSGREPILIQGILASRKYNSANKITFIKKILKSIPNEIISARSSVGQSPYSLAVQINLPNNAINAIKTATNGNNSNKNIYGRSVTNIKKIKTTQRGHGKRMRKTKRKMHSDL